MLKPNLDMGNYKNKTQHIDESKNTLCEKSQSVFFLYFFACKSGVNELELT